MAFEGIAMKPLSVCLFWELRESNRREERLFPNLLIEINDKIFFYIKRRRL
jgi:hypothetical protein